MLTADSTGKLLPSVCLLLMTLAASSPCLAADYSSPQSTAKAFAIAIQQGNAPAAQDAALADPAQAQLIEAMASAAASLATLHQAAIDRFGPPGNRVLADPHMDLNAQIDQSALTLTGPDAATLAPKSAPGDTRDATPILLKRVAGQWKVDMTTVGNPDEVRRQTQLLKASAAVAALTTQDIVAGKFPGPLDAARALQSRLSDATRTKSEH
jgi:hypothetical protein